MLMLWTHIFLFFFKPDFSSLEIFDFYFPFISLIFLMCVKPCFYFPLDQTVNNMFTIAFFSCAAALQLTGSKMNIIGKYRIGKLEKGRRQNWGNKKARQGEIQPKSHSRIHRDLAKCHPIRGSHPCAAPAGLSVA